MFGVSLRLLLTHISFLLISSQPVIHECNDPAELNVTAKWFYDVIFNNTPSEAMEFPQFAWIDVRDVAIAHINAMVTPAADGERFIASYGQSNKFSLVLTQRNLKSIQRST